MRCSSIPSAGLELGLVLFLGFRAAIQDEGSRFSRSAARRECPLCLGFPSRLQCRTAPRGGSVGQALRRETSALAPDRKLSLNPGFPVPDCGKPGFQPATQDVTTLDNLGTHGTDPLRERDLDTEAEHNTEKHTAQARACVHTHKTYGTETPHTGRMPWAQKQHTGRHTYTYTRDPTHREEHIHHLETPHTGRAPQTHNTTAIETPHRTVPQIFTTDADKVHNTQQTLYTYHIQTPYMEKRTTYDYTYHIATPHRWRHPTDTHGHGKAHM